MMTKLKPIHPGEIVLEEFLKPLALSPYRLAKAMGVPRTRVERLVREETPITADTALRLERALGPSAQFWMNLQTHYDLKLARDVAEGAVLDAIPLLSPPVAAE